MPGCARSGILAMVRHREVEASLLREALVLMEWVRLRCCWTFEISSSSAKRHGTWLGDSAGGCRAWPPSILGFTAERGNYAHHRLASALARHCSLPSRSPWPASLPRYSYGSVGACSPLFSFFKRTLMFPRSLFFSKQAEIAVVGLQVCLSPAACMLPVSHRPALGIRENLLRQCHHVWPGQCLQQRGGAPADLLCIQWSEDVVPTVAFNFRKIRKGNVTMKIWDVAGHSSSASVSLSARIYTYPQANRSSARCGNGIATEWMLSCERIQ